MKTNCFLANRDYTVCNALSWGFCKEHYRRANAEGPSWAQRFGHGMIATVELIPVMGQIASLSEMAIAYLRSLNADTLASLATREILHIDAREPPLPRREFNQSSPRPSSEICQVELSRDIKNLHEDLFPLRRQIDLQYRDLPWPEQMQRIVVLTQVLGGRGDIAAAAKAIALMQKMCPTVTFDWVLEGAQLDQYDPMSFCTLDDPSKVRMRQLRSRPSEEAPGDFLLTGPVKLSWGMDYIQGCLGRTIAGPTFGFAENAQRVDDYYSQIAQAIVNKAPPESSLSESYPKLHDWVFPSASANSTGILPMGLQTGSGVFLDQSRIEAPLSRGVCCPSYLPQIQNAALRKDILEAMHVLDGRSEPDYDQYSFNSGYAHNQVTWGKFVDCVAMHERNKHVVIVLNQRGEFAHPTTEEFQEGMFTEERLAFLKRQGYGTVIFKGEEPNVALLREADHPELERSLTVIVRPSFLPADMRNMQLASERLLATGDNTALEAWCARCKLYLYEDVDNGAACKWRFLQQQVDLARNISPNLSRLLALFGGDRRLPNPLLNEPLTEEKMAEMEELLNDPNLEGATLQFCDRIARDFPFQPVLEAALKRAAWHHCLPELVKIETEALEEEFRSGMVAYVKNPNEAQSSFRVRTLPVVGKRIQETVQQHLLVK